MRQKQAVASELQTRAQHLPERAVREVRISPNCAQEAAVYLCSCHVITPSYGHMRPAFSRTFRIAIALQTALRSYKMLVWLDWARPLFLVSVYGILDSIRSNRRQKPRPRRCLHTHCSRTDISPINESSDSELYHPRA